jgi:hypothetical protein
MVEDFLRINGLLEDLQIICAIADYLHNCRLFAQLQISIRPSNIPPFESARSLEGYGFLEGLSIICAIMDNLCNERLFVQSQNICTIAHLLYPIIEIHVQTWCGF